MIYDKISHAGLYKNVHPLFEKAFEFLRSFDPTTASPGKIELEGERLFAQVQRFETRPATEKAFEAHRKYIDIQYVAEGCELMECGILDDFSVKTPYNESKDIEFYEEGPRVSQLIVHRGEYGIFFPHDVHKPGCHVDSTSTPVLKVLLKIKVS